MAPIKRCLNRYNGNCQDISPLKGIQQGKYKFGIIVQKHELALSSKPNPGYWNKAAPIQWDKSMSWSAIAMTHTVCQNMTLINKMESLEGT